MYALSSKSGSEPFSFALFWGDLRWNDPKHKYSENSIRCCLIRQINSEVTWASTVEIKKHGRALVR